MQLHVQGQCFPTGESLVAGEADRSSTLGRSLVLPQVLPLHERPSTCVAGEGALPSMKTKVVAQVACVEEALATE